MGILYNPEELQNALLNPTPSDYVKILKIHGVNPDTITEIAIIDNLSVVKISARLYGSYALDSGFIGGGSAALKELLEWTGCKSYKIFELVESEKRIHLRKVDKKADWELVNP